MVILLLSLLLVVVVVLPFIGTRIITYKTFKKNLKKLKIINNKYTYISSFRLVPSTCTAAQTQRTIHNMLHTCTKGKVQ